MEAAAQIFDVAMSVLSELSKTITQRLPLSSDIHWFSLPETVSYIMEDLELEIEELNWSREAGTGQLISGHPME